MERKDRLYSSGEFAKLTGVNKRTLHYYNDIGLFRPARTGENGYHYYTCFQFAQLELILTLRKIGLPIDEIRTYMSQPSDESFSQMIEKKLKVIDSSIQQLLSVRELLEHKMDQAQAGMQAEHGRIELCALPEKKILLSAPISGRYDEEDLSIAAGFSLRLKKLFHLYDSFGSCIPLETDGQGGSDRSSSFFAYCPRTAKVYDRVLPAGTYLRAFCIGAWSKLPEVYRSILLYADEHGLTLSGYAYEEGLNEMAIQDQNDYVTMITIPCQD